jgi:hypothetical protein
MLRDSRDRIWGTTRTVRSLVLCLLVAVSSVAAGCAKSYAPDERSGNDRVRTGAQSMPLQRAVTDAVNYEGGDATDWKSFEVPAAGPVTVEVYFDNPFVNVEVGLYDSYGSQLARQRRSSGSDPVRIVHSLPEGGLYFVMIQATENHSVYSIRVTPGGGQTDTEQVVDPRPEFDRPI